MADPYDFSDKYNTPLSPDDEADFQNWAKRNKKDKDVYDYDMRGAWKAGVTADEGGHFPDTYKKPNHPTFSDESQYHGKDGYLGGSWSKEGDKDKFEPGPNNVYTDDELKTYFKETEPESVLGKRR